MNERLGRVTASLHRLGLPVTTGQWVGWVVAVLAGIIIARLLPFIYPLIFARLLDFVFQPGPSTLRDGFNSLLMTACTCGTSFLFSFLAFLLFRVKKQAAR